MKTRLITRLACALTLSYTSLALAGPVDEQGALALLQQENTQLIDVRSAEEFAGGALDNALLLPHEQIAERIASLVPDKQTPIVVYCRSGRRSSIAEDQLRQLGYRHVRNAGGYEQFRKTLADNPSTCSQC
ncbi:rhodanese-like domain-containing protein [Pseudomonas fluvialis]|jgi:phage shock protein E|uniref:rhodanese-like domain-containing protein n=1 Tax=Pseudomonas fluvialis TaxID=1793966 RepID=UPI001B4208A0|nr:rhodanese-like domain-containing protein [Pseudomonas sp.]MBP8264344.1 rhodanese-like domain-containing protein [Pseudomonas sp.]